MGSVQSAITNETDEAAARRNNEIETQIQADHSKRKNEVRLLVFGSADSGKSSLLKRVKLIHHGGFSDSERYSYKELVYSHLITSMRILLKTLPKLGLTLTSENDAYRMVILSLPAKFEFDILSPDVAHALRTLLRDAAVQEALRRRHEFNLKDSATYFFDAIERVASMSYLPTDSAILHCEKNETAITETIFKANQRTYKLTALIYQQAQTWIYYLDNVKAVVFVVSLKEYDHICDGVNRLKSALNEFYLICNWRSFSLTPLILLLNDADAFAEKLPSSPLINYFLDYHGDNSYDDACAYIVCRFVSLNRHPLSKPIYHYIIPRDTAILEASRGEIGTKVATGTGSSEVVYED